MFHSRCRCTLPPKFEKWMLYTFKLEMPYSRMVTFTRAPALTPSAFWKKRMEAVQ